MVHHPSGARNGETGSFSISHFSFRIGLSAEVRRITATSPLNESDQMKIEKWKVENESFLTDKIPAHQ
jgi:hypothetical protein